VTRAPAGTTPGMSDHDAFTSASATRSSLEGTAAPPTSEWSPPPPRRPRLHALARQIERLEGLDALAKPLGSTVRGLMRPGPVRDALSGRALGHALHPLLTDVPIGTWTSATLLDLVGGRDSARASERLIAIGVAAALPTAATGLLDWSDSEAADDEVRRVGVVHAAANVAALGLYSASLLARRRGRRGRGRTLGLAGAGALAVGGHLGGHLSYAKGVGVDATALGAGGAAIDAWTDAGIPSAALREGTPLRGEAGNRRLVLVRHEGRVLALDDRCSHRGGALHEGEVADGCITCPVHGSRFRLEDGSVERGPSPYPQPTFEVRERAGRVEVRTAHGQPTL
jgi:nitrite reductase/ring-hydroxylating ferredoxin subunit/uncharacterized membrane protein